MAFKKSPQVFNGKINEVTIGRGAGAVTIGGANVMPLFSFDAPLPNKVAVGVEISDKGMDRTLQGIDSFYAGAESLGELAAKAAAMPGADFVTLTLEAADPAEINRSVEDCVAEIGEVLSAIECPLAVQGCRNIEKDAAIFEKASEVYQNANILFVSCREENYKAVSAAAGLAYGQKLSAESAVDINLAKQLNVLISQLGVKSENYVMNVGSAAAGYGFEYVASTMDRVKSAALAQSDTMLQMPIITPVSNEAWSVKEAVVSEDDIPEWGSREARGIDMEISSAASAIACGSDAVILRHPKSVSVISRFIEELC